MPAATSYDEVPYPSYPLPQTHPDRLATLATLFGMTPAPVERCCVLELACGDGSNLIPMAMELPESAFVGVDLAERPIAQGQAILTELGLKNISLRPFDILELSAAWGTFDYIIAHGLYSWVPPVVRDKILAVCKTNLAANGVAYVSYNTHPGGHVRRMFREMMLRHIEGLADPAQKVAQAQMLLKFLAEGQTKPTSFDVLLKEELERFEEYRHDELLFHDDLAEVNEPVYFHQFEAHARQHGLQYLAEADFSEMQAHIYPAETQRILAEQELLVREQYLDFLKCRRFRQTLLCHAATVLERAVNPECVRGLAIASMARPVAATPDLGPGALEEFRGPRGAAMRTDHPLSKAAILCLGKAWPRALPFPVLAAEARTLLGSPGFDDDEQHLAHILCETYAAGLVELHRHPPRFTLEPSVRPRASALARLQIRAGLTILSSLRHRQVQLDDPVGRRLVLLLDGSRDRAALVHDLADAVAAGLVAGAPTLDRARIVDVLTRELDGNLANLARLGLLSE